MFNRRSFLATAGLAAAAPWVLPNAVAQPRKRILVFTRSAGFQHDVVKLDPNRTCLVHEVWKELAAKNNFDVECTKDGRVFLPESLARFDAFFFFTTEDLTAEKSTDGTPPMPKEGKKALLDAIAAGKGFIGSHCASDTFHSRGGRYRNQSTTEVDPYIAMLGGEFIGHGDQQPATQRVIDGRFPGVPGSETFSLTEEWYSLKNFARDLHVILVQETQGMRGHDYQRPHYPATWTRRHGQGRVFYTSMGHREDVWHNPLFQHLLAGAVNWATGRVDVDTRPNMDQVAPQATALPPEPPPKPPAKTKSK
jgi:type 1 glutamine amidotransferase